MTHPLSSVEISIKNMRLVILLDMFHQEKLLLCLISSFPLTESLLVPYAYVSIESKNCISSLITLYLTLLNICCVCNNSFFMNSL